ncbi:AAEL008623-PA [Aedes aegypti]|uniref:Methyltransferase HEMK2 n=1 Tax=Aedes aegypti TaxID=7159 RepID=Q16Y80_AEDAE|nr:AAEL008623-PA [Aedes aegypti]
MQTPAYKFQPEDYDNVYEPAEDSFLLLDALEDELDAIKLLQPAMCVEIGPGSGIVISAIAKALHSSGSYCMGVDINPHACRMTQRTGLLNDCRLEVVNMDLLGGLADGCVDLLVFNPPYVPTAEEDSRELEEQIGEFREDGHNLVKSWAGGFDGMVVTNRLLKDLDRILSERGVFYLLLLKENKPMEVINCLGKNGFLGKVVKERKIRGEHLFVIKISRKQSLIY